MKTAYIYISLLTIVLLAACGAETNDQAAVTEDEEMRIISLMPSNTEIISELGAKENLTAVTVSDNYPEDLSEDLTRLDSFALDEEAMMALEPSHIVSHASGHDANKDIIDRVASSTGAEVLVVDDAQKIEEIYSTITNIGEFIGKADEAERLNTELQETVGSIQAEYETKAAKGDALLLISTAPDIYIAGNDTFMDDFLHTLNINNAFDDLNGFPAITSEDLISRAPNTVISSLGISNDELTNELNNIAGLQGAPITSEENQCTPNPDIISRPGPRFTEGLAAIAACVYE